MPGSLLCREDDRPAGPGSSPGRRRDQASRKRGLVFGAPGMACERGGVGERQALAPESADRVIVSGDRMEGGERGAGVTGRPFSNEINGILDKIPTITCDKSAKSLRSKQTNTGHQCLAWERRKVTAHDRK